MAGDVRYPTDLTDKQWTLIEPLLPPPKPGGRPESHPRREIVNAILYVSRTGCAWRMLPKDFPPWETVYWHFARWRDGPALKHLHDQLRDQLRVAEGREPEPTAGIVDSQSLRGADTVGAASRGWDGGKKVNGRKRHIITDTMGLLVIVLVTAGSVQDRDGGRMVLRRLHRRRRRVSHVFADGGYAGRLVARARTAWNITVEVVAKPADQKGFVVLPRRWVVERTFAWLMRWRRLARDYERSPRSHEAFVRWAMIGLMVNRLAPRPGPKPWAKRAA